MSVYEKQGNIKYEVNYSNIIYSGVNPIIKYGEQMYYGYLVSMMSSFLNCNKKIINGIEMVNETYKTHITNFNHPIWIGCISNGNKLYKFRPFEIKTIETGYLRKIVLNTVDLSCCINLGNISENFMYNTIVENLVLPKNIKTIEKNFMLNSINKNRIDLSNLVNLEYISNNFMNYSRLSEIKFPINIIKIGNMFMSKINNSKLTIDLSNLNQLEEIGDDFVFGSKMNNVIMQKNIKKIGSSFMKNFICENTIDLSMLEQVNMIRDEFLFGSIIKNVILPRNILWISEYFMCHFKSEYINLSNIENMIHIGDMFMCNVLTKNIILPQNINRVKISNKNKFMKNIIYV